MEKKKLDSSFITKAVLAIVVLIAIVVAFLSYQHFNGERNRLEQLNKERGQYLKELEGMQAKSTTKIAETKEMDQLIEQYLSEYPNKVSHAKAIQNVYELITNSGIEVENINPTFDGVFYEKAKTTPKPKESEEDTTKTGEAKAAPTPTPVETPKPVAEKTGEEGSGEPNFNAMEGYVTTIKLSGSGSYEQIRKAADFIVNHENKMTLEDISLSYNTVTGLLSMNMTINMYDLVGGKAPYAEPSITDVDISKDPLFKTTENKEKKKKE